MARKAFNLGAALVALGAVQAQAEDFPPALLSECTLQNVAGAYGFNEDSVSSAVAQRPIAFVGLLDLRADGTAEILFTGFIERGGETVTSDILEGEWTVEPNCLGFIDFPKFNQGGTRTEFDYQFVAVENASELFLVRNNPLEQADAKLLFRR